MRKYRENLENLSIKKIRDTNIAFVVDECHRAVTPEKKLEIERFFKHSRWY